MSGGVRKIAQVAVGAVIGFVQGGPVGAAIGAGMAFYMAEQQEKLNTKSPMRDNEPSAQTVRSSKAPARFILGRVSTGGVLVWAQEQAGDQTDGEWLHLVYVLCEGPVDALENIYLGEEEIATYGEHATYELVVNPTQVNAFLKANCPDWKDEQIGRGLSFVRLSLKYSAEKFPSGIPDARFIVRGRNDIYDPRSGTAVYTENTALHILWYLRNRCGVPDDEIVFETFASGANICDESVANPDNTTSPRYRSSCVIGADEQRTNVLQKLEAACGGRTIRVGGRWMFQAGAYYGPYDFEITEDMVVGTITGSTEPTNDAAINTVRGTFIDTSQSWTETDYPEVSIADWVIEDGGEAAETLSFSYVTDAYQAQRLANIELRRRRAGGTISIPMNFLGYNCRPGRAVRVNLPSLNILGEFIVTNWSMGADQGCTAQLQQYDPAQFDDAVGQPYNPIGFIKLPAGGLGSPTGLTWSTEDNAESVQGTLSWAAPSGVVTSYAITVRQGSTAVQAQQVPATALKLPLSGLPSGSYTMSVAALGPLTRSGEASIAVSIDGPPIPESCVVQATIDTITLIPSNTLHGLNGGTYEYFFSTNPQATEGEYLGQGLSLTHTGLAFATNYAYFVRSKNAYGVSAFLKVVASTSTDVGNMLDALKGKIENGQLAPALREEISLISGPPTQAGSVAQRLAAEAAARAKAISDEAAARAQGLLAEAQARGAAVTSEAQARQSADDSLSQKIDTVTASTGNNAAAIQSEITARTNADTALGQRIDTVAASSAANSSAISNEITARTKADSALASQIATIRAESGGFDTALNYGFASTVEAWSGTRCSLAVENGRLIVTNTDVNAYLNSPVVSIRGRDHDRVRCRITRRAGTGWTGQITYVTASHASSTSYRKVIPDPGLAVGQSMVLEWDMSQLTAGGSDWSDSTITRFYLWLSPSAGDVFEIDWIAVGQIAPSASVASVVDERTARISGDEANASAITGLSSSLQTTNGNVTAAQQAAQAASDKAGGKGEVIYSSTEPATDKRLAQNLWIDITGAANTPKRWTGSAWVAVTDKVATDAAAAAASALAQVAAKADASALQALQTSVTNQGNTLTAQGNSITQIKASIGQQPDNLILRGSFEDGLVDPWSGDARITNISAHPSAGKGVSFYTNSFCGVAANVVTAGGEQFDLSADIWPAYMTAGQTTRFQMQFYDKAGTSLGYVNAFSVAAAATGFKSYSGRITAPAGAVSARFLTRTEPADGSGRSLWCNIVARRVTAADSANADAISTLGASVTQQGNTLTSQGQALTQLQSSVGSIGGSGANLLSDEYSWLTSTTLPALIASSGVTRIGVAVPEADSGFGYQVGNVPTGAYFLMLSPINSVAGYNVRIEPGVYLVSMYVRGSVAGSMRASLFDGAGRISGDVPYTTTRTRITLPITVTDSTRAAITLYPNRTGVADLTLVIDSVMIEKRIGESNTPSPFVAGPSARAVGGQATAISQMDTVVKQQGTAITAQASRLDGLYVQVNPEMEGDSSGMAGATGGLVGVWTEQSARIEDGIAMGRQVETVQAQLGQTNASVQQVSEVMADINGRVSAQTTLKVETNLGGRKVVSGIAIGSNGEEGEILLMAQRLAIIDSLNGQTILPFVVEGGQVFINQAVINTAFIQQIVAGMTIRSAALNAQGLPLLEINFAAGTFTLRGQDANGSTLLNNGGLYVYDANGVERTAVGRLT
ncbi:phage tail tip fiber protein [Pseudomonas sp. SMV7]|uniref:phage tail tip fiber protein n=1 Tax=Pseudomonas sp. SMV7 TaxID=3390194 RepID=UPI003F841D9A